MSTTPQMLLPERNARFRPSATACFMWSNIVERPVLVVADREPPLGAAEAGGVGVGVDVRDVGHVVAVLLHPEGERELPEQELARADRERGVEDLAVLAVGPVEARLDVRAPVPLLLAVVVERELAGPAVVGVPGGVGALEQEVGPAVVADDEDDVALQPLALGRELAEVDAAGPVVGDRQRDGTAPRRIRGAASGRSADRAGPCPANGPELLDQPPAVPR